MWTEGRRGAGDYMVGHVLVVTAAIAHHQITRRDSAHDADATYPATQKVAHTKEIKSPAEIFPNA